MLKIKNPFGGISAKKLIQYFAVELFFLGLYILFDQLMKRFFYGSLFSEATGNMQPAADEYILIKGWLVFTPQANTGASFGALKDYSNLLLIFSSILIAAIAVFYVFSVRNRNNWFRAALVLILAGGAGNLIDRAVLGFVRDFVYVEIINFAVFNPADSALTVGCVLLCIYVIFFYRPEVKEGEGKNKRG